MSDDGQVSGWHTPRYKHTGTPSERGSFPCCANLSKLSSNKGMCRYCQWPQELMLRLEGTADLHQIQMLSHEYKVAPAPMMCHQPTPNRAYPWSLQNVVLSEAEMLSLCDGAVMVQIASKVELHVGTQHVDTVSWKRLGSFSFDSNERSKLQSRELKSVTVSVQALFLRIVLARCHINSQNIYKQVRVSADQLQRMSCVAGCFD